VIEYVCVCVCVHVTSGAAREGDEAGGDDAEEARCKAHIERVGSVQTLAAVCVCGVCTGFWPLSHTE